MRESTRENVTVGGGWESEEKVCYTKPYEELEFTDDFMFCKVLTTNKELCKELLEVILKKKIRDIQFDNGQQVMQITYDGKSIRMDVYVEDERNTVYDLEMQMTVGKNLPKRSRYYQGIIDLNLIEKGADYVELKESFIIFICLKDPFGEKLPIYTFENQCQELPRLKMGDGTRKIFLNAAGKLDTVSPELNAFLLYIRNHRPTDEFTNKLQRKVKSAREHKEWRVEYMTYGLALQDAKREGQEEKRMDLIYRKAKKGKPLSQIADELECTEEEIRGLYERVCNDIP